MDRLGDAYFCGGCDRWEPGKLTLNGRFGFCGTYKKQTYRTDYCKRREIETMAKITEDKQKQVHSLFLAGLTKKRIAEEVGISIPSVSKIIKEKQVNPESEIEEVVERVIPPSPWNSHMCLEIPKDHLLINDGGEPYVLGPELEKIVGIRHCPWCGIELGS